MKFKLVQEQLNEGYEILWKQFEDVADIKCNEYHLHHIYNDTCSSDNGEINFVLLPASVHKHMPKNIYRSDAIEMYHYMKAKYPEQFRRITVSFDVFTPDNIESITSKQKQINIQRRNSRRNRHKKPSIVDIINNLDKEQTDI